MSGLGKRGSKKMLVLMGLPLSVDLLVDLRLLTVPCSGSEP